MKSNLLIVFILVLLLSTTVMAGEKSFFADLSFNSFSNSDSEFKDVYKSSIMVPQIIVGYFFSDNLYAFAGFEFYKVDGKTPKVGFDVNMNQKNFLFGGGYSYKLSDKLNINGELGILSISYTETLEILNLENKGSCVGFLIGTKLKYGITDKLSSYLKLTYYIAKDNLDDIDINFGGLNIGIGIRILF